MPSSVCSLARTSRKLRRIADSNFIWRNFASDHFGLPQSEWSKFGSPKSGVRKLQEAEFTRQVEQTVIRLLPRSAGFTEALGEFRRNPDETTAGRDFLPNIRHLVDEVRARYEKPTEEWRKRSEEEYAAKRDWKEYYRQCYELLCSKTDAQGYICSAHLSGGHRDSVWCLQSKSPDSDLVYSADEDGTVIVWDTERGKQLRTLRGCHKGAVYSMCLIPDEEAYILTGGADGKVSMWDWTRAGNDFLVRTMTSQHADAVNSVSFCPVRRLVCSGGADDIIQAHNIDTGILVWKIDGCRTGGVNVVRFLSHKYLATVGMDAILRIWKRSSSKKSTPSPPKQIRSMKGHSNLVTSLATWKAPDGEIVIVTGSYDGTARLWNLKTGHCIRVLSGHDGGVESVSVIQCEKDILVCVSRYRAIRVWNLNTGELIKSITSIDPSTVGKPPSGPATMLVLRDMIMTTCDDLPTIKIWKATTRDQVVQRQSPRPVF